MKRFLSVLAVLFAVALPLRSQIQIPPNIRNDGSTGTATAHLVKITGVPSAAVIATAGDISGAFGICDSSCGTSSSPNISNSGIDACAFDNGTVAGDYVQISGTVNGDCHDTGSATLPTSGEVIGRALSTNGSAGTYNILLILSNPGGSGSGGVNSGNIGQPTAYSSSTTVSSVPLSIVADAVTGSGISATPTAWVAATTYPLCQVVSNSGNYIAVSTNNSTTTPGTNRTVWYPIPNGSRPTQFDCAFYIAQSLVTSTAGVNLQLGSGVYSSCIGMTYPTVGAPGLPGVNIIGAGPGVSTIKQTCTLLSGSGGDGLAMLNVPVATVSFSLPRLIFRGFTLDANGLAWNFDLHACQQCFINDIDLLNPAFGSDHAFEAGTIGGTNKGWVFELNMQNVALVYNANVTGHGHGNGAATFTVAVSGGVPTITVTNGGLNYDTAQMDFRLVKTGGLEACSSVGTFTPTVDGSGTITAVTTTSTGCAATGLTFLQLFPGLRVDYGFKFSDMTDSDTISNLDTGVGRKCGIYTANVDAFNVYYKLHPQGTFDGVCTNGSETFIGTQIDSVYNHGINIGSSFNQETFFSSGFEWNGSHYTGSSDWYIQNLSNPPTGSQAAITSFGDSCGNTPLQDGYAHIVSGSGVVDTGSIMPPRMNMYNTMYCNQFTTATQPNATNTAADIIWSNGKFTNIWDWDLGSGGNTTMTLTGIGNPWVMNWLNPTPATSGANAASPQFSLQGQYWDGTVTQPYGPRMRATFAAGASPLATFRFDHLGTEPGAGHVWTFDAATLLPTGSTAVTQAPGDTSTDIATDGFVANAILGVAPSGAVFGSPSGNVAGDCVTITANASQGLTDAGFPCPNIPATAGAHTFLGNNTSSSGPVSGYIPIGTSDITPNLYCVATGSTNVYVATLTPAATALTAGLTVNMLPNAANTSTAPTVNVNSLGAVTIIKANGQALVPGDLAPNTVAVLVYDGTNFQLTNPATVLSQWPCAPQAGLSDTVDGPTTSPTETLFTTVCKIPANTLVTNTIIDGQLGLDWTGTAVVPNSTFKMYLCPTSGSLTGCKGIYTGTTSPVSAGTFSATLPFVIIGRAAAGGSVNISQQIGSGVSANTPFGRNTFSGSIGSIPTNADLYIQFTETFAANTAGNSYTIRSLIFR